MSILQAVFMGIIQGVTEFLPVSSSGHLAIFKNLFSINTDTGMLFDVLLHVGTLLAVCLVYYRDILRLLKEFFGVVADCGRNIGIFFQNKVQHQELAYVRIVSNSYRKMGLLIIVSTIPTAVIGLAASDLIEMSEEILLVPGIGLLITGVLLLIANRTPAGQRRPRNVTYTNAFLIGICQGVATLPGISRSGTTITACLVSGFEKKFAVKYSFIMSIPAILGSLVFELKDIGSMNVTSSDVTAYLIGTLVAFVVGFICIKTMLVVVKNKKFTFFAVYCFALGILSVAGYFYTV